MTLKSPVLLHPAANFSLLHLVLSHAVDLTLRQILYMHHAEARTSLAGPNARVCRQCGKRQYAERLRGNKVADCEYAAAVFYGLVYSSEPSLSVVAVLTRVR